MIRLNSLRNVKPLPTAIVFLLFTFTVVYFWGSIVILFEDHEFGRKTASKLPPAPNGLDRDCQCKEISKDLLHTQQNRYCSDYTISRGPNQKVISFSFYGGFQSKYFNGIKENIKGVKELYPGYVIRLYHDLQAPISATDGGKLLCKMYCAETILDLCNVRYIDWYRNLPEYFGMLWRFTPMADPLVSEWHSRDLDSRISDREVAAVKEWKESGRTYHIMRDNPVHGTYVVGCCFGMKITEKNQRDMKQDFEHMLLRSKKVWKKGLDQDMLELYVWKRARYDMIWHDSYLCTKYKYMYPGMRPFPTKRLEGPGIWNFVGSEGGFITLKDHGECPKECRPKQHPDWLIC